MIDFLGSLITGFADMIGSFFEWLIKPLTWLMQLLDGIFYFFYKLFLILGDLLGVFLAFFQLLIAVSSGLLRTVTRFMNWSGAPLHTGVGMDGILIFKTAVEPLGLLRVLPYLVLALDIFCTAYLVMWLIGGRKT